MIPPSLVKVASSRRRETHTQSRDVTATVTQTVQFIGYFHLLLLSVLVSRLVHVDSIQIVLVSIFFATFFLYDVILQYLLLRRACPMRPFPPRSLTPCSVTPPSCFTNHPLPQHGITRTYMIPRLTYTCALSPLVQFYCAHGSF